MGLALHYSSPFHIKARTFTRLDFGAISVVCVLVDQMGPIPALQATTRLLEFADVKLVAVLGLGGALDKDVAVGDVVIASEVNEFQANSKAEPARRRLRSPIFRPPFAAGVSDP